MDIQNVKDVASLLTEIERLEKGITTLEIELGTTEMDFGLFAEQVSDSSTQRVIISLTNRVSCEIERIAKITKAVMELKRAIG